MAARHRPRLCGCRPGLSLRTHNSSPPFVSAGRRPRKADRPEDWPGHPWRHQPELRVTNALDVAAAVAGAGAVLAHSGALMALAWALGVPHVALGREESGPSAFAAWTGDASALAADPGEIVANPECLGPDGEAARINRPGGDVRPGPGRMG